MYTEKTIYGDYCKALYLAVEYTKEDDPTFSLGVDPYADVSTLSQKKATTPKQADGSRTLTPRAGSHTRKSSVPTSAGSRTSSSGRKRPNPSSGTSSTRRKGGNGLVVDSSASSPSLPDVPEVGSSRKRQRNQKCEVTESCEKAASSESEAKRHRTSSDKCLPEDILEGMSRDTETVPRKLEFDDDGVVEDEDNSGPATKEKRKSPLLCEGTISNGHEGSISNGSVNSIESLNHKRVDLHVTDSVKPVTNREKEVEKVESAGLSSHVEEESMSTDENQTTEEDDISDSDDDNMPAFSCNVDEDLKGKRYTCTHLIRLCPSSFELPYQCLSMFQMYYLWVPLSVACQSWGCIHLEHR